MAAIETIFAKNIAVTAGQRFGGPIPGQQGRATVAIRVSAACMVLVRYCPNTKGTDLYEWARRDFAAPGSDVIPMPEPCVYAEVEVSADMPQFSAIACSV